jgi:hypothetical protein
MTTTQNQVGELSFRQPFTKEVDERLRDLNISRVAADPARVPEAANPGGARQFKYFRLHGSPKVYYSSYPDEFIAPWRVDCVRKQSAPTPSGVSSITPPSVPPPATRSIFRLSLILRQRRSRHRLPVNEPLQRLELHRFHQIVPESVQRQPCRTLEIRTRMFRQGF